ncbi:MAG: serine/threonine protein kinase, partial [bacterium]
MKKIKHYKIVELLGSGGMGKVYKAFDLMLERDVAIKVLHRHLWNDKKTDDRFLQEARAIARLVHPNIVTIHEVGMAGCGRYIVMEFVQGIPLGQLLMAKGALEPEYSIKLAKQVLSGLFSAHKLGILHRDIKLDNILIADNDIVKILDFGIAKMTAKKGLTAAGDILGTVEYMAPEQMLGEIVDHRCDIYAAGVVLYQMLTKRLPFQGKDAVAILYKIMNEDPAPPSYYNNQVGQELDQIVLKAISKTREERWETAEAFSIALESVLQNDRHPLVLCTATIWMNFQHCPLKSMLVRI